MGKTVIGVGEREIFEERMGIVKAAQCPGAVGMMESAYPCLLISWQFRRTVQRHVLRLLGICLILLLLSMLC